MVLNTNSFRRYDDNKSGTSLYCSEAIYNPYHKLYKKNEGIILLIRDFSPPITYRMTIDNARNGIVRLLR